MDPTFNSEKEKYNTIFKPLGLLDVPPSDPKAIDCKVGVKFSSRTMCQCYWCHSFNDKEETYCAFEDGFFMLCERCNYCFRGFSIQEIRELIEKRRAKWKELDEPAE